MAAGRQVREEDRPETRGLWHVLQEGHDHRAGRGVELLEQASREQPDDPGIWSDLGAAYLVRAGARGDRFDVIRALEALDTALELRPELAEGLFNRALVFERLGMAAVASAAWKRSADLDSGSGWRDEALARARSADDPHRSLSRDELRSALLEGDRAAASRAIDFDRQRVRELAVDDLLPDWGESWIAGDREISSRLLELLTSLGEELAAVSGDHTVPAAIGAIRRAVAAGGEHADELARGHVSFRRGRALFNEGRCLEANRHLETALRITGAAGSPISSWAAFWLAASDSTTNDYSGALARVRDARSSTDLTALPALDARLHWVQGLIELRTGFAADSLESFLESARIFREMGENLLEGGALALSAESYRALGRHGEAWTQRLAALQHLESRPSSYLHNLLLDAAAAARDAGVYRAAVSLQSIGVANARILESPTWIVEAILWRSKVWSAAGRLEQAAADLDLAQAEVGGVRDAELRRRLGADLHEARGMLWLSSNPASAREQLARTIEAYEEIQYRFRLPAIFLSRARAGLALDEPRQAEVDLEAGIREIERRDRSLRDVIFRHSHFEQAQQLFDTMIGLQVSQGRPLRALAYSERARMSAVRRLEDAASKLSGRPEARAAGPVIDVPALRSAALGLPPGVALIEYASLPDRLVIWRADADGIRNWQRDIAAGDLSGMVEDFLAVLTASARDSEIDRMAEALFEDLAGPALEGLAPGTHLVFVPDRSLARVPFAALRDAAKGRYLIEDFVVSNSLGLSFLTGSEGSLAVAPGGAGARVALVANPDGGDAGSARLPAARQEVAELARQYPAATLLVGRDAEKSTVLKALSENEIFHYAGHGMNDELRPWASYIPLAPGSRGGGGRLYAHELFGEVFRSLELVVLSACRSSGARDERTLPVSGLTLAFLEAGVPQVAANLWDVGDEPSRDLLVEFHRRLSTDLDSPRALRAAILHLIRQSPAPAPRDWAGLTVWH